MTDVSYDSIEAQASYGIGIEFGVQLKNGGLQQFLIPEAILAGIKDAIQGNSPAVEVNAIHSALRELQQRLEPIRQNMAAEAAEKGRQFLEQNKQRPDVITTESGLQYQVLTMGNGPRPTTSDKVKVNYTGRNVDGQVFDSTSVRGEPIEFVISGAVKGLQEALLLMPVGSKWQVVIPPGIGYGDQNGGQLLPPQSTLIFELDLLSIV